MVRIIIVLLFCFPAVTFAQTYQQLSERAIECIEKDSLPQAEELLLRALKLEPKNAKNATSGSIRTSTGCRIPANSVHRRLNSSAGTF